MSIEMPTTQEKIAKEDIKNKIDMEGGMEGPMPLNIHIKAKNEVVNEVSSEDKKDKEKKGLLDKIHSLFEPKYNEGRANRALAKGSREEWFYNDLKAKGKIAQAEQYKIALGKGLSKTVWNEEKGVYMDAAIKSRSL